MNGKVSKLLSRFCHLTGRNYLEMKKWYEGLTEPQRVEANAMMRQQLGEQKEHAKP